MTATAMIETPDVLEMLKRRQGDRSQKELAAELNISVSYLSEIYKGAAEPGAKVLDALNLERRVVYVRKKKAKAA